MMSFLVKGQKSAVHKRLGGEAPLPKKGGEELLPFCPPPKERGGCRMYVTYADLFQFCIVIIGVVGLVYKLTKKK